MGSPARTHFFRYFVRKCGATQPRLNPVSVWTNAIATQDMLLLILSSARNAFDIISGFIQGDYFSLDQLRSHLRLAFLDLYPTASVAHALTSLTSEHYNRIDPAEFLDWVDFARVNHSFKIWFDHKGPPNPWLGDDDLIARNEPKPIAEDSKPINAVPSRLESNYEAALVMQRLKSGSYEYDSETSQKYCGGLLIPTSIAGRGKHVLCNPVRRWGHDVWLTFWIDGKGMTSEQLIGTARDIREHASRERGGRDSEVHSVVFSAATPKL